MIRMYMFQLFYLITDLYREGNAKEMKKWAYEIHSTFLVPGAVNILYTLTIYDVLIGIFKHIFNFIAFTLK